MNEFELIDRYFRRAGRADVALGVGDDGAVVDVPAGRQLVCVVDTVIEGVHFPAGLDAADIGFRAVAVNLSDIAAMGAEPRWMTLALTLPAADPDWLQAFARGLFEAAAAFDVALVGGDTTRGRQLVASVQLLGTVEQGRYLTRHGSGAGQLVYVSGAPGEAAAGLELLRDGATGGALVARFRRPMARVALGQAVATLASAAIDVSDGLAADLGKLLAASGVGATLEVESLPLSDALLEHAGRDAAIRLALGGGDDYELCMTVPAATESRFLQAAADCGVAVTRIGTVTSRPGLVFTRAGEPVELEYPGYDHF